MGGGEAEEGEVGDDAGGQAEAALHDLGGTAGEEDLGRGQAARGVFGEHGVEQGLDKAGVADDGADADGLGGGFADDAGDGGGEVGDERELSGALVQITRHERGAGRDDAALVAALGGDEVEGDGGAEVDDDGGAAGGEGVGAGGVGQAILADLGGARIGDGHAEGDLMGELPGVEAGGGDQGAQARGGGGHDGAEGNLRAET